MKMTMHMYLCFLCLSQRNAIFQVTYLMGKLMTLVCMKMTMHMYLCCYFIYLTAKCPIPSDVSDGKFDYSGLYEDDYAYVFKLFDVFHSKMPYSK